jgi:hypothetical protein
VSKVRVSDGSADREKWKQGRESILGLQQLSQMPCGGWGLGEGIWNLAGGFWFDLG